MMNIQQIHEKTFKREIAYLLIAFWAFITYWVFFALPPAMVGNYERIYETFTWVTWLYVSAAMGMKVLQNISAGKLGGQ